MAGGSHGPVMKSWRGASSLLMPHLAAVDRQVRGPGMRLRPVRGPAGDLPRLPALGRCGRSGGRVGGGRRHDQGRGTARQRPPARRCTWYPVSRGRRGAEGDPGLRQLPHARHRRRGEVRGRTARRPAGRTSRSRPGQPPAVTLTIPRPAASPACARSARAVTGPRACPDTGCPMTAAPTTRRSPLPSRRSLPATRPLSATILAPAAARAALTTASCASPGLNDLAEPGVRCPQSRHHSEELFPRRPGRQTGHKPP